MGTCKECEIRHPDWNCPIENNMNKYYQPFFEAFLDSHAIVCEYKECVCRSDSFIKLISTPVFKNSKKYGSLIERILSRDKPKTVEGEGNQELISFRDICEVVGRDH